MEERTKIYIKSSENKENGVEEPKGKFVQLSTKNRDIFCSLKCYPLKPYKTILYLKKDKVKHLGLEKILK